FLPRTLRHVHAGRLAPHVGGDLLQPRLLLLPQFQQRLSGVQDFVLREGQHAPPLSIVRIRRRGQSAASACGSCTWATPTPGGAPSEPRSHTPRRRSSSASPATPCRSTPRTGSAGGGHSQHAGPCAN